MKFYKLFLYLAAVNLFILSCDDDVIGPESPTDVKGDVEVDIENIETSINKTLDLLNDLDNEQLFGTIAEFREIQNGDQESSAWMEKLLLGLFDVFDLESNQRFETESYAGVYEWGSEAEAWIEAGESNQIILKYSSSEESQENDMMFTLSEYADVLVNVEGEQAYLPTRILAELEQDEELILKIDLSDAQYAEDSDVIIPTVLDLEIYTAPYTYSLNLDRSTGTNFSFALDLTNENTLALGIELDMEVSNENYGELDEGDIQNLSGVFRMTEDLALNFEIGSLSSISTEEEPSENPLNALVDLELFYKNDKVGDLKFSEQSELVIIYQNDSSEPLENQYEDIITRLEEMLAELEGVW